jgi:phytoene desaturase
VTQKAIVIGAGVGGLTAAMKLAHAGLDVELYEKSPVPGGRCGRVQVGDFRFDLGPTILLMPFVLQQQFASIGRRLEDHLEIQRCDPHYRVHFRDGSRVVLWTDQEKMKAELEQIEPGSHAKYEEFLKRGKIQNDAAFEHFITRHFSSVLEFVTPRSVPQIVRVGALSKLWSHVSKYFADDRLRQALSFQTMYLGVSPYDAPAVFALLPYTEAIHGIWFPKGGMHAVPLALAEVCREEGVALHLGKGVKRVLVENGKAVGVELEDGQLKRADVVLCNADYAWGVKNLLPTELAAKRSAKLKKARFTSSGLMMYLGMKRPIDGLLHHNVFFGRDFKGSFNDIFEKGRVPDDISFYVNAPTRTESAFAPPGKDALQVLVPVPPLGGPIDWKVEAPKVRAKVLARLKEEGYGDLEPLIEVEQVLTPDDWQTHHNLERGSNFGLAQNFMQLGPFRPRVHDPDLKNLYWCGASVQPGTGVPTVMISAGFAVDAVLAQLGGSLPAPVREERVA